MADLFVFEHPLALFGPTGIDDNGEEWLNGERPRDLQADQWADAWWIRFSERGKRMGEKDDALGVLDVGHPHEQFRSNDFLLQPSFRAERAESPDMFEGTQETWRNTDYFQADRGTSLGEETHVKEAIKSGLPLTTVEQYDCRIFSRQIYPTIGQEIVLNEDKRVLPEVLETLDSDELNDHRNVWWRWRLSKKGKTGFSTYLRWMRSRRAVCKLQFPGLHNLSWYLESTDGWMRVGRTTVRGTMCITGLQLLISEMWGPGYLQYQRHPGSWFQRAMEDGAERILHLTLKCQHEDEQERPQDEGVEGSRCWFCGIVARFFEMGYISTSHFFRYIERDHMRDVFHDVYPSACKEFHKQMCQLTTHLANCDMHLPQANGPNLNPAAISLRNRPCFSKHDAEVRASDQRLMMRARKRLAWNTGSQREHLLSEGSMFASYEGEVSIDLRGEDNDAFNWHYDW